MWAPFMVKHMTSTLTLQEKIWCFPQLTLIVIGILANIKYVRYLIFAFASCGTDTGKVSQIHHVGFGVNL
jgi:hypothetical protein